MMPNGLTFRQEQSLCQDSILTLVIYMQKKHVVCPTDMLDMKLKLRLIYKLKLFFV